MKKIISILLVVVIIASISTYQSFSEVEGKNEITKTDIQNSVETIVRDSLKYIESDPESFGFNLNELSNSYFGTPYRIIDIDENFDYSVNMGIVNIPIVKNDEVIGIINLVKSDGEIFCSIGKDYSNQLTKFFKSQKKDAVLISYDESLFITNLDGDFDLVVG
ncbi:hypothetical protein QE109_02305 [Fusibacter bizertensis]|uniref:Uncharacterized protein n=1 Tax=Fusibacter bizertensis TaxID=1488331 RepID=A0ABT6N981_9FIRM|nr:hypothetical protein [Fusibacter bizertensis]MDH8676959.1 hypothetical protein [Fusibacter bizertensis]